MNRWGWKWWAELQGRVWALRRLPASRRSARSCWLEFDSLEDRCLLSGTGFYQQFNLVSDQPGLAQVLDPNLVNAWGIALPPTGGAFWISDNHTGVTTLYSGAVNGGPFINNGVAVSVPGGALTGQVFNGTGDFIIHAGTASGPALFIFASASGQITGWNPVVPGPGFSKQAEIAFTATDGAIFTGITLASNGTANFLYAADFHNGTIDVFDHNFQPTRLSGSFTDSDLPAGFAPFNIQYLGGKLYVTYAKPDAAKQANVPGAGNGFVDVFDTSGNLVMRLGSGGALDSPWGLALAPADFGAFSNALLVGNFGDGRINAFDPQSGHFLGQLDGLDGNPLAIDGLWGLSFGNGVTAGGTNVLYFAAGPAHETHGLFGALLPADRQFGPSAANSALGQGVYVPGASGSADDAYPLAPAGGPTFREAGGPQPGQLPVLLPTNGLPLALIPGAALAADQANAPPAPDSSSTLDASVASARDLVALLGSDGTLSLVPTLFLGPLGPSDPTVSSQTPEIGGPESTAVPLSIKNGSLASSRLLPGGNVSPVEQPYTVDILLGLATHPDFLQKRADLSADSIASAQPVGKHRDLAGMDGVNLSSAIPASSHAEAEPAQVGRKAPSVPEGAALADNATQGAELASHPQRKREWLARLLPHFIVGILASGVPLVWAYVRAGSTVVHGAARRQEP
jgi:uncharacterized protein (TIGR03118 family)